MLTMNHAEQPEPLLVPDHYSYSSIKTWYQCEARWLRRYLLGEPDAPSYEAKVGTFVHEVLEQVVSPEVEPEQRSLDNLRAAAHKVWNSDWLADLPGRSEFDFKLKAWTCLSNYAELEPTGSADVTEAELELNAEVEWRGSRIKFLGFVDRVDVANNGAVTIVDYKTGRKPAYMYLESAMRQLMIYADVMRQSDDWTLKAPTTAKLIYLGDGEVARTAITPGYVNEATDWFLEGWLGIRGWLNDKSENLRDKADRALEASATPSRLCGWCSYEHDCEPGQSRPDYLRSSQHRLRPDDIGLRMRT